MNVRTRTDLIEINNRIPDAVLKKVNTMLDTDIPEEKRGFGSCHSIWQRKKQLLKQEGYEWYSPDEIYPTIIFD